MDVILIPLLTDRRRTGPGPQMEGLRRRARPAIAATDLGGQLHGAKFRDPHLTHNEGGNLGWDFVMWSNRETERRDRPSCADSDSALSSGEFA